MNDRNQLYPVFLRLDRLRLLVVGAGEVGHEKLNFLLKSSPNANVTIVAPWMGPELKELLGEPFKQSEAAGVNTFKFKSPGGGSIEWLEREFLESDAAHADLIIAATNFKDINLQVWDAAKRYDRIINVADTPHLCDLYLGSIVTRGPLKVAVSTNGQSPTFAKRFRQWLEKQLPERETAELLDNLKLFRDKLSGDFNAKVKALNEATKSLVQDSIPNR
ncbi:MAG: bifunctional precorrin-2 dehydrogenase/sirohydrochlorin ferrochelatase [Bacteroidota bacterium]